MLELNKSANIPQMVRARFLSMGERNNKLGKVGEAKMNPVALDWNWSYQQEFIVFNVQTGTEMWLSVYAWASIHTVIS